MVTEQMGQAVVGELKLTDFFDSFFWPCLTIQFPNFQISKPRILLSIGIARLEPGGEWATGVLDIACIVMGALIALVWLVVMIAAA